MTNYRLLISIEVIEIQAGRVIVMKMADSVVFLHIFRSDCREKSGGSSSISLLTPEA